MWEFLAGITVGLVAAHLFRSRSSGTTASGAPGPSPVGAADDGQRPNSLHATGDTQSGDGDDVYADVERLRRRAKELGLPDLAAKLTPDIQHWPSWIRNEWSKRRMLRIVRSAEVIDGRVRLDVEGECLDFAFKDHHFTTPDGASNHHADADIFANGKRVLGVSMSASDSYGSDVWRPFQVNAFIEGSWIATLKKIDERKTWSEAEEKRLEREEPAKMSDLKKDFGLE